MRIFSLALLIALALSPLAQAGKSNCCTVKTPCVSSSTNCQTSCSTTRWYKAKDGTLREMLPYMTALSRAEDADDLEIELRGVQEELVASQQATEAAKQ
ncbi:MAG: hypothetical protein KDA85_18235 [Planctomycetaceae bacterium]|nr:hypothetical protein [Planctomycetaceae bacterium]